MMIQAKRSRFTEHLTRFPLIVNDLAKTFDGRFGKQCKLNRDMLVISKKRAVYATHLPQKRHLFAEERQRQREDRNRGREREREKRKERERIGREDVYI